MTIHRCTKCEKVFDVPSKLKRHLINKKSCEIPKTEYKCEICNVNFSSPSKKKRHEETSKHIKNVNNIYGNYNQVNINGTNIQNIINLTLNTKTFNNTNVGLVSNLSVELIYGIYNSIITNKYMTEYQKAEHLFKEAVIFILDKLHFNIGNSENHNLKILLMFPKIDKLLYEYLILEIEPETSDLVWNKISYEQLLEEIFNLLRKINEKNAEIRGEQIEKNLIFTDCIDFLKENLLDNEEYKKESQREIERLLNELYIKFNKEQKKANREVKLDILEKINEYKNYRNEECRLSNGFVPKVINSEIK